MKRAITIGIVAGIIIALTASGIIFFVPQVSAMQYQSNIDLGQKFLSEGKYEQAIIAFDKAIKIDVKPLDAYLGSMQAYRKHEMPDLALAVMKDSLNGEYRTSLETQKLLDEGIKVAEALTELTNKDLSVDCYEILVKLDRKDITMQMDLAKSYDSAGDTEKALAIYDVLSKNEKLKPDDLTAVLNAIEAIKNPSADETHATTLAASQAESQEESQAESQATTQATAVQETTTITSTDKSTQLGDDEKYVGTFQTEFLFSEYIMQNKIDQADTQTSLDGSTLEMVATVRKFYDLWDVELNSIYKKLMTKLSVEEQTKLRDSQKAWLLFHINESTFVSNSWSTLGLGSLGKIQLAMEEKARIRTRTLQLMEYYYMLGGEIQFVYDNTN